MREPLAWSLGLGVRAAPGEVADLVRGALAGPVDAAWNPPSWLLPHQRTAAQRLAARLAAFGGALLADAVGLGKTYVALAIAGRYARPVAVVPAHLVAQWERAARQLGILLALTSHEALSRGRPVPEADLLIVDEAHRFRNPETRRYDVLARAAYRAPLLLLTATPLVNRPADLVGLLRLFLADNALALFGVRSLEAAAACARNDELAHALSSVAVARTAAALRLGAIPAARDAGLCTEPTAPPGLFDDLALRIAALRFPTLGEPSAAALMRLHLFGRLASSLPALRSTLARHRRYLDLAGDAACRGERTTRRALFEIFGPDDDLQLAFEFPAPRGEAAALDRSEIQEERGRIVELLDLVRRTAPATLAPSTPSALGHPPDPKADRLCQILAGNEGEKTIVFTGAMPTAFHLARALQWRRLVVATGRGARIASGPLPLAEALTLFAPRAQGAAIPIAAAQADVLIATDLASEGLNLQDARTIVHYDLPWSPLRLSQRLGRIARLGSAHGTVDVWWFAPPSCLADRLAMARRIARKAEFQIALGTAATSAVGRAEIAGGLFDWRDTSPPAARAHLARHAAVQGPLAAAFVLEWRRSGHTLPEVLVFEGDPPGLVLDERRAQQLVQTLAVTTTARGEPPAVSSGALTGIVRSRLAAAHLGPRDTDTRRLIRRVVRRARRAAKDRDVTTIAALDRWLDRLVAGLPVGPLRQLSESLDASGIPSVPAHTTGEPGPVAAVTLRAALFGDGSQSQDE